MFKKIIAFCVVFAIAGTVLAQPPHQRGQGRGPAAFKGDPAKMLEMRIKMLEKQLKMLKEIQAKGGEMPMMRGFSGPGPRFYGGPGPRFQGGPGQKGKGPQCQKGKGYHKRGYNSTKGRKFQSDHKGR